MKLTFQMRDIGIALKCHLLNGDCYIYFNALKMNIKNRLLHFAQTYEPHVERFALNFFGSCDFFENDQGVTVENILALAYHHPELNINWLFTGKGGMIYRDLIASPVYKEEEWESCQEIIIQALEEELKVRQGKIDNLRKLFFNGFFHDPENNNSKPKFQKKTEEYKLFNQLLDRKNTQLFNAFILARPRLFEKNRSFDYDCMRLVFEEFYKYLEELDKMGKHEIYSG